MKIFLIFLIQLIEYSVGFRKIVTQWNPNCTKEYCRQNQNGYYNLIYTQSLGSNDIIHFIWSSIDVPCLYVIYTLNNTNIYIDWEKFFNHSTDAITWNGLPLYRFAIFMPELHQTTFKLQLEHISKRKIDPDIADITNKTFITKIYSLNNVSWHHFQIDFNNISHVGFLKGYHPILDANITFKISFFENSFRSQKFPHFLLHENLTKFSFILSKNSIYNKTFPDLPPIKPLYSLKIAIIDDDDIYNTKKIKEFQHNKIETMDDEYTPGLFYTDEIVKKSSSKLAGYLQWKSIYFDKIKPLSLRDSKFMSLSPNYLNEIRVKIPYNITSIDSNDTLLVNSTYPSFIRDILRDRTFVNLFSHPFSTSKNISRESEVFPIFFNYQRDNTTAKTFIKFYHTNFCFYEPTELNSTISAQHDEVKTTGTIHQYISWPCLVGLGRPPVDNVSSFIILLTCFGFGLPLSLVFFAYTFGTFKLILRRRQLKSSSSYSGGKGILESEIPVKSTQDFVIYDDENSETSSSASSLDNENTNYLHNGDRQKLLDFEK